MPHAYGMQSHDLPFHNHLLSNTLDNKPHREQDLRAAWVSRAALIGVL